MPEIHYTQSKALSSQSTSAHSNTTLVQSNKSSITVDLTGEEKNKPNLTQKSPLHNLNTNNFMSFVCSSYKVIKNVFKYLNAYELLNAAKVCTMWRDIALSPGIWEVVSLSQVHIYNWDKFSEFLNKMGTRELDMRHIIIRKPSFLNDENELNS